VSFQQSIFFTFTIFDLGINLANCGVRGRYPGRFSSLIIQINKNTILKLLKCQNLGWILLESVWDFLRMLLFAMLAFCVRSEPHYLALKMLCKKLYFSIFFHAFLRTFFRISFRSIRYRSSFCSFQSFHRSFRSMRF
jgi:hypothetical protein